MAENIKVIIDLINHTIFYGNDIVICIHLEFFLYGGRVGCKSLFHLTSTAHPQKILDTDAQRKKCFSFVLSLYIMHEET